MFPSVDPIPLPAPVWLLKALHITTLSLHFVAVELLLGGLLIAVLLNLFGRSPESRTAAAAMARRLTVVMTYVINLGVPPLLFAQVLYGQALYTSSVLIGAYWIAVIFLLMACYWLLYRFSSGLDAGRQVWWIGLAAWLLAGGIAGIYSSNMTLMLRPEAWPAMYSAAASGVHLPTGDPTLAARWLFMLAGGFLVAGLWMIYLGGRGTFEGTQRRYFALIGGRLAVAAVVVEILAAGQVAASQPAAVQQALRQHAVYPFAAWAWLAVMALIAILGLAASFGRASSTWPSWGAAILALLEVAALVIYRDGIRDLTLLGKGFDVWQRTVATNWSVVILFLILFVAGLAGVGWLISVVARSKKVMESVA